MYAQRLVPVPGRTGGRASRALALAAFAALLLPLLPTSTSAQLAGWQPYHRHVQIDGHTHEHPHPYDRDVSAAPADGGPPLAFAAEDSAQPSMLPALLADAAELATPAVPPLAVAPGEQGEPAEWTGGVPTEPPR